MTGTEAYIVAATRTQQAVHFGAQAIMSFPAARPAPAAATRPAGSRSARNGASAGSRWPAGRPRHAARGRAS